ncbi:MAG TPA: sigma-70 family RNA polymerase sigma factor [Spirochaetia bacterium]|nr:sigma-70 family RNA polymerase sigma factor [Spirochaetia bacterium]HRZ66400.1 sigma-70 family RNA polymerase sigma factor [Spirochaetia bacterium]
MNGEPSDEEAIARVLDGDTEAFAILVRRHQRRVLRVGLGFFHDEEEAADFAQDVFVKAYTALGSFQGKSQFSTWLLRIAYNSAVNLKKRRRSEARLDPELDIEGDPGVDESQLREESARAVREAVAGLPPKQALCVELCFYYDLTYPEISEITGFPVNTIKSHVFRAKRLLRERLGEAKEARDAV